jgi:predicted nucleic acid-binding protein
MTTRRSGARESTPPYDPRERLLFDTSVLVAGLIAQHPLHERAGQWLKRVLAGRVAMVLPQHALAECYSALTVLPVRPAVTPELAVRLLRDGIIATCHPTFIALGADDYLDALQRCSLRGRRGGKVHDAVIARCAERGQARILTFNHRDLALFCANGEADIVSP